MSEGKLYCLLGDMNASNQAIDVIDANTLDKLNTVTFKEELGGIAKVNTSLYIITESMIFTAHPDTLSQIDNVYKIDSNDSVDSIIQKDNSIYIMCYQYSKDHAQ